MKRRHLEDDQARWLMTWARANARMHPELHLLYHCPNGGWRDKREAARLKSMGVRAGIPDYFLPVPIYRGMNDEHHGLYVELKSADGRLSGPQAEWGRLMLEQGYAFKVCKGWVEAARAICEYLGLKGISP